VVTSTKIMDGNEAVAYIAYKVTETIIIYPITPSTPMGEHSDKWATNNINNIWGITPQIIEMQSEAGVAAALHGAIKTGSLATTFTSSQGLLLMLPNMYKISGELLPTVIHVASRAISTHGLSIFGDHSDVMGVRHSGFIMLASSSVQEAHDFALIAHAAVFETRIPILHFFDGFRTSHEMTNISCIDENTIKIMLNEDLILEHRNRALTPENPTLNGTTQNADVYFQGRERSNQFYSEVPRIIKKYMHLLSNITGRKYSLVKFYGDKCAERIIIIIGSGSRTAIQTVDELNKLGEKIGVIQISLYRPFPIYDLIQSLPSHVYAIAVMDRTKEPGAPGEPLYQDVITTLVESNMLHTCKVVGGRYGLASKEFTPAMVKGIFDNLKEYNPKNHFTVGIKDDITFSSINYDVNFHIKNDMEKNIIFYGIGSDGTIGSGKSIIKIIGDETNLYVQSYFVYDSKKYGGKTEVHIRFSKNCIDAPYLIGAADFISCNQWKLIFSEFLLNTAKDHSVFLLNTPYSCNNIWLNLPEKIIKQIVQKKLKFFIIDADKIASLNGLESKISTIMQTCFFMIFFNHNHTTNITIDKIKEVVTKTFLYKGQETVEKNLNSIELILHYLFEVKYSSDILLKYTNQDIKNHNIPVEIEKRIIPLIMNGNGNNLPVSSMPCGGVFPTGTAKWDKRIVDPQMIPQWNAEMCIQCGQCSTICPHSIIRSKLLKQDLMQSAPSGFQTAKYKKVTNEDYLYRLQIYNDYCTGCGLCHEICPIKYQEQDGEYKKAINLIHKDTIIESKEVENLKFFTAAKHYNVNKFTEGKIQDLQYLLPYFEFSSACPGCGETPYLKMISQLYGSRMLIANATGCSSIYGGNLPTTPWTYDNNGRGPAWANSLFEDNAEFGYGFKLSENKQRELAIKLLNEFSEYIGHDLVSDTVQNINETHKDKIIKQYSRILEIKNRLKTIAHHDKVKHLNQLLTYLIKRSIWIIGGDGWAYDIGYGGLDHVLASGEDVNILVLDTSVYSNTGGQSSKATPLGAVAKFSSSGKKLPKKDLGMIAMTYKNVYVAQIALAANPLQALRVINEAENYNGPSLIIAYCHCIAHGYNLQNAVRQQKLAVKSGFWPLYHYNPKAKQPLKIDALIDPNISIKDFICNEGRFKHLLKPSNGKFLKHLEHTIKQNWQQLQNLAALSY